MCLLINLIFWFDINDSDISKWSIWLFFTKIDLFFKEEDFCVFFLNLLGTLILYTFKSTRTTTPQDTILSHTRLPFRHKGLLCIQLNVFTGLLLATGLSPYFVCYSKQFRKIFYCLSISIISTYFLKWIFYFIY